MTNKLIKMFVFSIQISIIKNNQIHLINYYGLEIEQLLLIIKIQKFCFDLILLAFIFLIQILSKMMEMKLTFFIIILRSTFYLTIIINLSISSS